jgi:hypothetical protein
MNTQMQVYELVPSKKEIYSKDDSIYMHCTINFSELIPLPYQQKEIFASGIIGKSKKVRKNIMHKDLEPMYWQINPNIVEEDFWFKTSNKKKIEERLIYLDEIMQTNENRTKYIETKQILEEILNTIHYIKYPYIGVDDDGQICAEWHKAENYKIVSLIPLSEQIIKISCLKASNTIITVQTSLSSILQNGFSEISIEV